MPTTKCPACGTAYAVWHTPLAESVNMSQVPSELLYRYTKISLSLLPHLGLDEFDKLRNEIIAYGTGKPPPLAEVIDIQENVSNNAKSPNHED